MADHPLNPVTILGQDSTGKLIPILVGADGAISGNGDVTVFASAARTATPTPYDGVNYTGRGLQLTIDVTAAASTPSTVFTIQGKDAISGKFYTILASAAIVGVGTTILRAYPGLTAAANLVASDILPRSWRVTATHGNSNSQTYTVGASVII